MGKLALQGHAHIEVGSTLAVLCLGDRPPHLLRRREDQCCILGMCCKPPRWNLCANHVFVPPRKGPDTHISIKKISTSWRQTSSIQRSAGQKRTEQSQNRAAEGGGAFEDILSSWQTGLLNLRTYPIRFQLRLVVPSAFMKCVPGSP